MQAAQPRLGVNKPIATGCFRLFRCSTGEQMANGAGRIQQGTEPKAA